MRQLSRPYQVVLLVMGLFVAVWLVALRGHSGESAPHATSSSTASAPAKSTPSPGAPSKIYHGPAPGLEGLTRDINKAHEAVAASERNAAEVQRKSEAAASGTADGVSSGGSAAVSGSSSPAASTHVSTTSTAPRHASAIRHHASTIRHHAASRPSGPTTPRSSAAKPNRQAEVEKQLARGDTVLLLFWNPAASEDRYDRASVQALLASGAPQNRHLAVQVARAGEVGAFGSITRAIQIASTPTILIITPEARVKMVTGLSDPYSLTQAISEARH